jgi:acyl carrier protein
LDRDEILQVLKSIRPDIDFVGSPDYISDGLLDSFDVVTLVSELESKLGIQIPGEMIVSSNFSSVDAILRMISHLRKGI